MKAHHKRRHRRQTNMHLRSRGKFVVGHKSRSGRTGSIHAKQLRGRASPERHAAVMPR